MPEKIINERLNRDTPALGLVEEPPPLGRLVLRGDIGLAAGGGRRAFFLGDERGARTAKGAGADG